jgi:hypothetical protein
MLPFLGYPKLHTEIAGYGVSRIGPSCEVPENRSIEEQLSK